MRLLLINSEYPPIGGGAGNATAHIAQHFANMGHETIVVTSRFEDLPYHEQSGNLTVYRIPSLRRKQDRSGPLEQIIFILSAAFWTAGLVSREKPDATLAFFGAPSGVIAYLLKKRFNVPYVVSLRGGDVPGFRPYDFSLYHRLLAPSLRMIWRNAGAVVANSNGLRDLALAFDSHFEIPIIPNGVNLALYFTPERDWQSPRVLSVGRLVYQKGFDIAMHAMSGLADLDWHWTIAGDGPEMESLRSLAERLGISNRIIFAGWQSRTELIQCYKQSNLFLFPSRHEGMPNAVLEAMASGLPVIATRIAGNEELVVQEKTGFLVESENVASLRAALRKLIENPTLRTTMGADSRQRVQEFYSWESTAKQYAALLEKVK